MIRKLGVKLNGANEAKLAGSWLAAGERPAAAAYATKNIFSFDLWPDASSGKPPESPTRRAIVGRRLWWRRRTQLALLRRLDSVHFRRPLGWRARNLEFGEQTNGSKSSPAVRRLFDAAAKVVVAEWKIPPRATSEMLLLLLLCYQILTRRAADLLHCSSPSGVLFIARAIANKIISSGGELQNLHNFTQREQIGAHATLFLAA